MTTDLFVWVHWGGHHWAHQGSGCRTPCPVWGDTTLGSALDSAPSPSDAPSALQTLPWLPESEKETRNWKDVCVFRLKSTKPKQRNKQQVWSKSWQSQLPEFSWKKNVLKGWGLEYMFTKKGCGWKFSWGKKGSTTHTKQWGTHRRKPSNFVYTRVFLVTYTTASFGLSKFLPQCDVSIKIVFLFFFLEM